MPLDYQIKAWHRANRKMGWGFQEQEFQEIPPPPDLTEEEQRQGFEGLVLFYGFGDDGRGNADSVLSGKKAWDYARKCRRGRTWQCEYVRFDRTDYLRLRPAAPPRPRGFYYAALQPGAKFQALTANQVRRGLGQATGCGPEGIQFLAVTHPHVANMMNEREFPFMALIDYDVAPYGFEDFFDCPQIFCSTGVLGIGIGNVDRYYPSFGIPTLHFPCHY